MLPSSGSHANSPAHRGSHSPSDDQEDDFYPRGFPLDPDVYVPDPDVEDEALRGLEPGSIDPSAEQMQTYRQFTSLFPYDFLDRNAVWPAPAEVVGQPLAGHLRQEMVRNLAMTGHFVEFVPPWTDPGWSARFVYTGRGPRKDGDPAGEPNPNDDLIYRAYAKQGLFQTLRPALREEDATRNPTDAAKRYGVDPNHVDMPNYGKSATTPTQPDFSVPLQHPRETPSNQGVKAVVDKADYDAVYGRYQNSLSTRGGYATEDDFRQVLQSIGPGSVNQDLGASCDTQVANALLQYMDQKNEFDLREEYQRMIFGGNTTNELVEGGSWSMDKTANSALNIPIHDLFTRERWAVTTDRGRLRPSGRPPNKSRKVYSFPTRTGETQTGEWCAANDFLWMAIQPALQLATMILNCDHPATWAFADIYKMRRCQGSRRAGPDVQNIEDRHIAVGVTRNDYFATYLEEDQSEFTPEQRQLKDLGFNSVAWVCELLKQSLVWDFNAKYGEVGGDDVHMMAVTDMHRHRDDPNKPFEITISIAADYIWPLLIDEYSQAEKATCSWSLATTMVHELIHAMNFTRDQLLHPDSPFLSFDSNQEWLTTGLPGDGRNKLSPQILRALQVFGYRGVWDQAGHGVIMVENDDKHSFLLDEYQSEEGFAVENQFWGGAPINRNKSGFLKHTRFIDELVTMLALYSWPGDPALSVYKMIPFHLISRLFTQHFWHYELDKWGHEAMKIWPLSSPRATNRWDFFTWRQVQMRFGWEARAWLQDVDRRVRNDYEHAVVWAWLYQLTRLAVEPKICMVKWHKQQGEWEEADKSLWALRNDCSDKAGLVMNYLQRLYNEIYSGQPLPNPPPPIEHVHFRNAFAALSSMQRALSNEASVYQLLCTDYHRQLDPSTKTYIHDHYAGRMTARLDAIHLQIITDCIAFLDMFSTVDQIVLLRIAQSDPAVQLLDHERQQLRERFVAVQDALRPVRLTFDEDRSAYEFRIQDFALVNPINAVYHAKRMEKVAKKHLQTMSGPLLKVAHGWVHILERGERLRDAAAGSADSETNSKFAATSAYISEVRRLHEQQVAQQHPPPGENAYNPLNDSRFVNMLQQNQNAPHPGLRRQRFTTVAPQQGQLNSWQAVYAEASGFVPYRDPTTGFTRFQEANIPTEADPSVNPTAAAHAQAQGHNLVGTIAPGGSALDAMSALLGERGRQHDANPALAGQVVPEIYQRALQTVAGPNGQALINNSVPGTSSLFGAAAAQSSMAQQQLEGLIRHQALGPTPQATPPSSPPDQPGPFQSSGGFRRHRASATDP